jgi:DNA replication and repair protein RecF
MFIEKIQINNFRNIQHCFLEFDNTINYFVGNNAQGKTSIIEALYFLGHNKSFKEKNIKNIINNNQKNTSIQAIVDSNKISITKYNKNTQNTYNNTTINNKKILHSSILSKTIPMQIIAPDKGFLVGGDIKTKRYYLDWGVFHVEHSFLDIYQKSKKIQKNINTLINNNQIQQLDVWFQEFAKINHTLNTLKTTYLKQLKTTTTKGFFSDLLLDITAFDYKIDNGLPSGINTEKDIYDFLIKNKAKIIKNKYLKYGSHLTNISFSFEGVCENQLSRGVQKTLSIIFWLIQVMHLSQKNITPIVLIDDISSELDNEKIQIILSILQKIQAQVFITSIHPINDNFYHIKNGEIVYNK